MLWFRPLWKQQLLSRVQEATEFSHCAGSQLKVGKKLVPVQKHNQRCRTKDVVIVDKADTTEKRIKISMCAIWNNVAKVKGKHLVFKTSIAGIHTRLLIDNDSKTKLINKFFARLNKISTFQLEKPIQLTLGNSEAVQHLTKKCLVDVIISKHHEQILCYLAKLNVYTVILGNGWLQTHNPAINSKNCTIKFNFADCIKKGCLLHGKSCIEFAISCKLKHKIEPNKSTASGDINIQQVSAKHFFWMARKKNHKSYLWIPKVSTNDCTKECCAKVATSTRK